MTTLSPEPPVLHPESIPEPARRFPAHEVVPSDLSPRDVSLLQSVMEGFERETGLRMSFDDLTGARTGMHEDVPAMLLDWDHQSHACSFCLFAKGVDALGDKACVVNKLAANRLVSRRRQGLAGYCHLGLFDMAEPLIYQGRVMGVFYFGSVRIRQQEEITLAKIRHYCERRGISEAPYLEELARVPVVEESAIPRYREILKTMAQLAHYFCEATGVKQELYRDRKLKFPYTDPEKLPYVVKEAIHYVASHLDESFIVKDLAAHLRCHPDFLSRKFKHHTGVDLSVYLQQARIERAKRLLSNPKVDIGDAAIQCGFSDRVHFSKVFRRMTGQTPGQFQKQLKGE